MRPKDRDKDQTYFLYRINQEKLAKVLFPVGDMYKSEVKKIADDLGFKFYQKIKESQDLCFISSGGLGVFLESYLGKQKGYICLEDGTHVGEHDGYYNFTMGQRRGLINLKVPQDSGPYFVYKIDPVTNTVYVTNKTSEQSLFKDEIILPEFHKINHSVQFDGQKEYTAKQRSTGEEIPLTITETDKGFVCKFQKPVRALTAGQHLVVYDGEVVVGGGKIGC
jgi:tRNA-specific 2-thiouridylase